LAVQKFNESPIKTVITDLVLKHGKDGIKKDEIMREIIKFQRLDQQHAETFWQALLKLGLGTCRTIPGIELNPLTEFCISDFAIMRGYLTSKQVHSIAKKTHKFGH